MASKEKKAQKVLSYPPPIDIGNKFPMATLYAKQPTHYKFISDLNDKEL